MGCCDFILSPNLYRDILGENYDEKVLEKMVNNPIAWVNSLPMSEYAHVMLRVATERYGGDPRQYLEVLWYKMIVPVLAAYYMELERYRFYKHYMKEDYINLKYILPAKGVGRWREEIVMCTCVVKRLIRELCGVWQYLANKPYDDPFMVKLCNFCGSLMQGKTYDEVAKQVTEVKEEIEALPDAPTEDAPTPEATSDITEVPPLEVPLATSRKPAKTTKTKKATRRKKPAKK